MYTKNTGVTVQTYKGKQALLCKLYKYRFLLLMLAPAVIYLIIFHYVPMVGAVIAFKGYNYTDGIFKSPWVGFDNFKFFFQSGQALLVSKNTILYNAAFIIVGTVLQLFVSIMLAEVNSKLFRNISQSIMFLPHFISWVVVAAFTYNILNFNYGILNKLLQYFSINPINVYATPSAWKYILIFANTWKGLGYGNVIYLAAIMGIDIELYEAAQIDGANVMQRIRKITLPSLVPTIIILTLLSIGTIFRGNFQMFYQLVGDNGLLYNATDVIDTFTFRALMKTNEIGMSAAVGLYQSVMCFVCILVVNYFVRCINSDSALF